MDVWKENQLEVAVCNSTASFQELLDSQKELFQCQIDQLQNIVGKQCKLTGVNPLSQEMAAGALSVKIGKRPRDLLNPKAVKYMQSVFSIKDAISKKESREISALFGVTVTQVREFFTGQRSRVRKFVRLSRDKALKSSDSNENQDGVSTSCGPMLPIDPVPLNSVGPASIEERPSCSPQDECLPGIDGPDKHFIDNIFIMMRKEETFSGQVKLMEWILQIKTSVVLMWFLSKGGVMILATWLSQAAIEEQTSVLHVILKVLCHLPLHKALPVHMSAILQSVNKLRFYRTSDISNRARILLSRWSKLFARTQAMKKPNAMKSLSDAQNEMLLKQSIGEIRDAESWDSEVNITEAALLPSYEGSENNRKLDSSPLLKLLPASVDDSKKLIRGVSSSQTRERRKVLLVEQPGQKMFGRSAQSTKSVPANQSRPLSADDIQKAKMRAQFMQIKYGKPGTSSNEEHETKISEGPNKISLSLANVSSSPSKSPFRPKIEEQKKSVISEVHNMLEAPLDNKINLDPEEPLWKKCKRVQIQWLTPPEITINGDWSVGNGDHSKEVEIQKNRIRREKEIVYKTVLEIPSDPKEPWDQEMDYDDTLTPEIPTEQLPDADAMETVVSPVENGSNESRAADAMATTSSSSQNGDASMPEPDLELLAVLLKNPELVFALTSGQGCGLSAEDTVKLLDMIKANNGVNALGNSNNGFVAKAENHVEVSLPSPTPSSNPVPSGWTAEVAKNPFSRHVPAQDNLPVSSFLQPQMTSFHQYPNQTVIQTPPAPEIRTVNNFPVNFQPTASPSAHIGTFSNGSQLHEMVVSRTPERPSLAMSSDSPLLSSWTRQQQVQPQPQPQPSPVPKSWRNRQGVALNPHLQASQSDHNAQFGGPYQQGSMQPGPPAWERDQSYGEPGFETWSPERNQIRSPTHYGSGLNYGGPRMGSGHNHHRIDRSGSRGYSGYRDHNRYDNGRWRDRRR